MEPRRTPARRAGLVALAALLVFGASACSGGSGLVGTSPAATVNGTDISQATLMENATLRRDFYADQAEQAGGATGDLAVALDELSSDSADTVGTTGTARVLSDLIADEVIRQELARHDALPTDEDRKAIRDQLEQEAGAEQLEKLDKEYVNRFIRSQALNRAFTEWTVEQINKDLKPYTEEERQAEKDALYEQSYAGAPLCLNAIQAATQEEAAAARASVDGGQDFVAVAQAAAAQAGGSLPDSGLIICLPVDQATQAFGADFSTVAVGDLVGPLEYATENGTFYLVFRVDSVDGLSQEELADVLDAQVATEPTPEDPAEYDASVELNELIADADIDVNPQFGRWSPARLSVVAPKAPADPTESTTTSTSTTLPVLTTGP